MTELNTEQTNDVTPEPEAEPAPTNSEDKKSPAFLAVTAKLAEYERKEKEREEADAQAQREAEEKALRDAGRFDELEAKYRADMEAIQSKHAAEILQSNLKTELIKTGFANDMFINGAIQGYNADTHGDVQAYVASLAEDENHKGFLSGEPVKTVHTAPGKLPSGGSGENWDQVKADIEGPDRQKRIEARAKVTAYREKTGEYPY
jgi:hypothetical protein